MKYLVFMLVFLCLACTSQVVGQDIENLFSRSTVYVDSSSAKNISIIAKQEFISKFYTFTTDIKDQSFTDYTYWIKFNSPIKPNYYVISRNIFIDKMVLYSPSEDGWKSQEVGLLSDHSNGQSVLSIKIPDSSLGKTCYLQVQSSCISKLDLWILQEHKLFSLESFKTLFYGAIITLILAYFIVVMFLFIATKRVEMLALSFYAVASVLMILFTNGFLYQWLPRFNILFYKWSFAYIVDIYWGSAALLSFFMFGVKQHSKPLVKYFYAAFILLALLMLTPFILERQLVSKLHFGVPILFIMFNTFIGFYLFLKKNISSAVYLSIGWLIYLGLLIIWSVAKTSHLPNSFFVDNAPVFGLILEFVLFATIGARHYLTDQKESDLLRSKMWTITHQKEEIEEAYLEMYNLLTTREREVLALISTGSLDKEIADKLGISVASVRTYSKRIYTKLNVSNRTEASIIYNNLKIMESL